MVEVKSGRPHPVGTTAMGRRQWTVKADMTIADRPDFCGNNLDQVHVTITRSIHMNRLSVGVLPGNQLNETHLHLPGSRAEFRKCWTERAHVCISVKGAGALIQLGRFGEYEVRR